MNDEIHTPHGGFEKVGVSKIEKKRQRERVEERERKRERDRERGREYERKGYICKDKKE